MRLRTHARSTVNNRPTRARQAVNLDPRKLSPSHLQFRWASSISDEDWALYRQAFLALKKAEVDVLLGGGFALASYTGRWRDTKDIDFYIRPKDRQKAVRALSQAGFADYFERRPYDRKWIYRSTKDGVIVDIIWSMANQRAQVDELWFERANKVAIRGEQMPVIPREELIWCKLYILQRDHCDWTDVFNLLYACPDSLDWEHLLRRLEDDAPLLKAMLTVYGWLCPNYIRKLPESLWRALEMPVPISAPPRPGVERIKLLDSRYWFAALKSKGAKLEV